jgi:hypothetical protein
MFHKQPNNVLVQLRPNLELLNHKKRRTLKQSIPINKYISIYMHKSFVCNVMSAVREWNAMQRSVM